MRILTSEEIGAFLARAGGYRPLIAVLVFAGLRIGEVLGLTWEDVDLDGGFIRVRKQLDRKRQRVDLKSNADQTRRRPRPAARDAPARAPSRFASQGP